MSILGLQNRSIFNWLSRSTHHLLTHFLVCENRDTILSSRMSTWEKICPLCCFRTVDLSGHRVSSGIIGILVYLRGCLLKYIASLGMIHLIIFLIILWSSIGKKIPE